MANEIDTLEQFLKVEIPPEEPPQAENGLVNIAIKFKLGIVHILLLYH